MGDMWHACVATCVPLPAGPATAGATVQTRDDTATRRNGRRARRICAQVAWDVGGAAAKLTVSVDASTFGGEERALLGVHVLIDATATRSRTTRSWPRATRTARNVDVALRRLDGTLSTGDCQDSRARPSARRARSSHVRGRARDVLVQLRRESPRRPLAAFRWAASARRRRRAGGSWDVMPTPPTGHGAAEPGDALHAAKERAARAHEDRRRLPRTERSRRPEKRRRRSRTRARAREARRGARAARRRSRRPARRRRWTPARRRWRAGRARSSPTTGT